MVYFVFFGIITTVIFCYNGRIFISSIIYLLPYIRRW